MTTNKTVQQIDIQPQTMHLVYRVCDGVNVCSARNRCFNTTKQQLIFKCLDSIKTSISNLDPRIKLDVHIVEDCCSTDTIEYLKFTFESCSTRLYKLGMKSNAHSFCSCVKIASGFDDNDIVFLLEDDYLFLDDNVFTKLVVGMSQIKDTIGAEYVGVMPDDYPDRYSNNQTTSQIVVTDVGHFMQINKTTCTFAVYAGAIKQNIDACMSFIHWPYVTEDQSVNIMWKNIPLFHPLPALTLHSQIASIIPRYLDFQKLNNYFEDK